MKTRITYRAGNDNDGDVPIARSGVVRSGLLVMVQTGKRFVSRSCASNCANPPNKTLCNNCGLLYERDKQLPPWSKDIHLHDKQLGMR